MARLVYLDEAGVSDEQTEPWLSVGGLLVHADTQLDKVLEGIAAVERLMPAEDRDSGLVLHPSFIYGGNGRFDTRRHPQWTGELRMEVLRELAEIPNKANILVTFASIERSTLPQDAQFHYESGTGKNKVQKTEKNRTALSQAIAYTACLLECDLYLRTHAKGENCLVIAEDTPQAKEAIRAAHRYHQDPSTPFLEHQRKHFPLRRIREDPAFQEKRQGSPLILADFIAFVIKRLRMKDAKAVGFYGPWRKRVVVTVTKTSDQWPD